MVLLLCGSLAEGRTGGGNVIQAPLLPGIGAHDPRIRVDPDVVPWRAIGKLQAASVNFRATATATLAGPSMVLTAAHCLFNRRTHRNFAPASLHFLVGDTDTGYGGHAIGVKFNVGDGYNLDRNCCAFDVIVVGADFVAIRGDPHSFGCCRDRVLPPARNMTLLPRSKARKSGSQTRRWREMDSNPRSRSRKPRSISSPAAARSPSRRSVSHSSLSSAGMPLRREAAISSAAKLISFMA